MSNDKANSFKLLTRKDIGSLAISLSHAAKMVEQAIASLGRGESSNPTKLSICSAPSLASYAMLGKSSIDNTVGMKNSFRLVKNGKNNYHVFLSLFDSETGAHLALMDGLLIGGLRTSLVSALIARECAKKDARSALIIGSGNQGQLAIASLLECNPQLTTVGVFGHYDDSIAKIILAARKQYPTKHIFRADDLKTAVEASDIIIGVAGQDAREVAKEEWIKPGALMILVGYGIEALALHKSDRVVTTSASQMQLTGVDLLDENGKLPAITAELHEILLGDKPGRINDSERIFAYNSGLVVTDIVLARVFYELAKQLNVGMDLLLWE